MGYNLVVFSSVHLVNRMRSRLNRDGQYFEKASRVLVLTPSGLEERQKRSICADDLSEELQPCYNFC